MLDRTFPRMVRYCFPKENPGQLLDLHRLLALTAAMGQRSRMKGWGIERRSCRIYAAACGYNVEAVCWEESAALVCAAGHNSEEASWFAGRGLPRRHGEMTM